MMGQEFGQPPLDAGEYPVSLAASPRRWIVAGGPVARAPLLLVAAVFGAVVTLAVVAASGVLDGSLPIWSKDGGYWPVSAALVALVSGAWLAGAILGVRMLINLPRWDRDRALFVPRWIGALVAFGCGPMLAALFFVAIGLGNRSWDRAALPALVIAAAVLTLFVYARSAVARLGEALLMSLFIWLAVLILPAFQDDPVSRRFAVFLLDILRGAGLLT
jgi:hypothetical protein